jgi:hypothetical protein
MLVPTFLDAVLSDDRQLHARGKDGRGGRRRPTRTSRRHVNAETGVASMLPASHPTSSPLVVIESSRRWT